MLQQIACWHPVPHVQHAGPNVCCLLPLPVANHACCSHCPQADPALLASGSDDCTVKLWSTKSPSSVSQVGRGQGTACLAWHG